MSDRSGSPSSEGEGDDLRPTAEDRDSSEESSEEDPEEARRIAEGFIQDDDDDDEDEDEDPAARRERKRREKRHRRRKERKQREAEEAELSEDELELLQENRGLGRSRDDRPYKRLKRRSGSPDEGRPTLQDMFRDDEGRGVMDSDDDMEDFIEEDEEEETARGETEADRRERKRAEKLAAREAAKARPDAAGVDRGWVLTDLLRTAHLQAAHGTRSMPSSVMAKNTTGWTKPTTRAMMRRRSRGRRISG